MGEHINSNRQSSFVQVCRRGCCICFKTLLYLYCTLVQNLLIGIKLAIFCLNWYLSLFLNDRMELQAQEVAVIQESLGLNCSLTVLGPDGLRLECLGVADECQGQQVKF